MGVLDIYYRAFKNYRKETFENTLCEKDRKAITRNNETDDKFITTKYLCRIDEDWVKTIEEGLVFVENAVREERQFIRTDGEVIPIEKVKRISKDSVEHLAKHSDLITRVPEDGADIVPDQLYMVEKLSDYAVYENRFLYMLLCYLRDFINYRLEKIETLRNTYIGDLSISKEIVTKKRTLIIKSEVREERTDNPFPLPDENSASLVKRIKDCMQIITSLLATDLMVQVAKSPMIKPPVVKTNVLKMNNNFKRALALYDYVATYNGQGYEFEEVTRDLSPYSDKLADEIAESVNLTAFTAYKFGNDIENILEAAYREEENRREEQKALKLSERIKRLKKRALESNKTLEEYMLLLEERNRMLEKDSEKLALIRREVDKLNLEIEELNREKAGLGLRIGELEAAIEEKEREIALLNQKYIDDMAAEKRRHEQELAEVNAAHESAVAELNAEFGQKIQSTIDEYELKISGLNDDISALNDKYEMAAEEFGQKSLIFEQKQSELKAELKKTVDDCEARIKAAEREYMNDFELKKSECEKAVEEIKRENYFIAGQLDAIRVQKGELAPDIDYTSRERFLELQEEFAAFERYFSEQWKLTKKQIRKQILWAKPEKKSKNPKKADKD